MDIANDCNGLASGKYVWFVFDNFMEAYNDIFD